MRQNLFGNQGFSVSVLGLGAGEIGDGSIPEDHVGHLLNLAVDSGINLVDTAKGYGLSEERIGRHLSWRRKDYILSTKVGYGIPGHADWSFGCITEGIETALRLMKTDVIDIVHLHSCPVEVLERGEAIDALERAKHDGKIKVAAYSGENDALDWCLKSGRFGGLQSSINVFDQDSIQRVIPKATANGIGYIAKRPVGNAPWRFADQPNGHYSETYWHRMKTMELDFGADWQSVALRFTAFHSGISSCIVGTTNLNHLKLNVEIIEHGPLPSDVVDHIRNCWQKHQQGWDGQV
ncbi:MAG: aldo/keto reductase [Bacteroidetes bacterium]|nr:aldo/keto reductase [Bacteroidota bacterium]